VMLVAVRHDRWVGVAAREGGGQDKREKAM